MNKKGQLVIIGIMILVMAILIFIATLPAVKSIMDTTRGCSYLNCNGYVDRTASGAGCTASNQSYNSGIQTDTLSCTILDLGIPFLILGVLVGLIAKLIHGKLVEQESPEFGGY